METKELTLIIFLTNGKEIQVTGVARNVGLLLNSIFEEMKKENKSTLFFSDFGPGIKATMDYNREVYMIDCEFVLGVGAPIRDKIN